MTLRAPATSSRSGRARSSRTSLLADEINRTPPKTQSALLEAMQEAPGERRRQSHAAARRRSSWSRPRTRSSTRAPTRSPRRSSTASSPRSTSATRPRADEVAHAAARAPRGRAGIARRRAAGRDGRRAACRARAGRRGHGVGRRARLRRRASCGARASVPSVALGASPRAAVHLLAAAKAAAAVAGRTFVIPDDVQAVARAGAAAPAADPRPRRSSSASGPTTRSGTRCSGPRPAVSATPRGGAWRRRAGRVVALAARGARCRVVGRRSPVRSSSRLVTASTRSSRIRRRGVTRAVPPVVARGVRATARRCAPSVAAAHGPRPPTRGRPTSRSIHPRPTAASTPSSPRAPPRPPPAAAGRGARDRPARPRRWTVRGAASRRRGTRVPRPSARPGGLRASCAGGRFRESGRGRRGRARARHRVRDRARLPARRRHPAVNWRATAAHRSPDEQPVPHGAGPRRRVRARLPVA